MKPSRLKNPLPLAVALGIVAGLLQVFDQYLHVTKHDSLADSINPVALCIGYLVCPAVISLFAPRRYFFWGFVPAVIGALLTEILGTQMLAQGHVSLGMRIYVFLTGLPIDALLSAGGVLLSSGPVSLIRYIVQRRRSLAGAQEDAVLADRAGKEGAWPPPPAVK